jgi:phosphoserine phosphatase
MILKNHEVVCFDVDNTLIVVSYIRTNYKLRYKKQTMYYIPVEEHIELLKKYHSYGKAIVVWSGGGYDWVKTVCKALQISKYVSIMMTKPLAYVDDLDANVWMTQIYERN